MRRSLQFRRGAAAATLLALGAVLAAAAPGCRRAAPRPDILVVTIDTLRADHCSSYGYPIATTPSLDAVAAAGVRFARTYAEASTTAPSHAVLMTGRHFRSSGVTKNGAVIAPEEVTLAERLKDEGYATAAFVSSFPVMSRFGFDQGFEVFDDRFVNDEASLGRRKNEDDPHDRLAGETLAHAEQWWKGFHDERPLFLWVHFVDPHAPYKPPETFEAKWPEDTRSAVRRYDGEVHYADKQLGHLLEMLSSRKRERIVVVTSDHGEGLGDHGWMSHGINLHEEAVRVPLVVSWPGHLEPGRVVDDAVGLIDIAPALLGLLGMDAGSFSHGRDLFAAADPGRSIFLQRRDYKSSHEGGQRIRGEMSAVVERGQKLISAPGEQRREFYDLARDPRELEDLLSAAGRARAAEGGAAPASGDTDARAQALEDRLEKWHQAFPAAKKSDAPMDKETLKALRSLGYVD